MNHLTAQSADLLAAAAPNLDGVKNTVIQIAATVLVIVLVFRLLSAWTKRSYGEIIVEIVAVLVIGFFIWTPDSAVAALQGITSSIFA